MRVPGTRPLALRGTWSGEPVASMRSTTRRCSLHGHCATTLPAGAEDQ
ncbi:hypothetical protein XOCgx_1424 [Xanthomonas oryzae pv. oryzicola]|nr:hypothetical protein XOCgx_1424 [Xanthomonas oryzae pv. oryzicola]